MNVSKQEDFARAEKRVSETPSLWPYDALLLYDWGDDAFWGWVATAEVDEIIAWAENVDHLPED